MPKGDFLIECIHMKKLLDDVVRECYITDGNANLYFTLDRMDLCGTHHNQTINEQYLKRIFKKGFNIPKNYILFTYGTY